MISTLTLIAKHGYGLDRYSGVRIATTFLSEDDAGLRARGWVHGHLADGSSYDSTDGTTYVLKVSDRPDWRVSAPVVASVAHRLHEDDYAPSESELWRNECSWSV